MGTFEFDGEKYKQASSHQKEWGLRLIAELSLKGDEKILDLGCGDGVLTKQLADIVPRGKVIGIDASEGMLKAADKLAATNLSFLLLDINNIDFKEEFDLIFSNAALHWVKDHLKLLQKCYFALKKGGILRFNFGGAGNCINFSVVVKKVMKLSQYKRHFADFEWPWYMPSSGEYRRLFGLTNFKNIQIWEQNADRFFRNADELIRWIDQPSIIPFIEQIIKDEKQGFRHEVIKRMLIQTKQPDGSYFETFRRINALAYK